MTSFQRIINKYGDSITGIQDLIGDDPPSKLFPLLASCMRYMLTDDTESVFTKRSVRWRQKASFIIQKLGPSFLNTPQIIENRNALLNSKSIDGDEGIHLPDEPVIFISNHAFKDDVLASVIAAKRHAYILFGSMPQFYNTFDGLTAWLNGVILVNRKIPESTKASVEKCARVLSLGADLLIYPEGVWNKSPNLPIIPLWRGVYRVACETGAKIVPIVHYIRDAANQETDNPIHTVIDDPIRIDNLTEKAALTLIRDKLATWFYLMMERYGQTTREDALRGFSTAEAAWEDHLINRVKTADRYDREIELCADYRPKEIVRPEQVWQPIAEIKNVNRSNASHVAYARKLLEEAEQNDFQRRY